MNGINNDTIEEMKRIDELIKEEKKSAKVDMHKIYRLEEQKLLQGMFNYKGDDRAIGKYRAPW